MMNINEIKEIMDRVEQSSFREFELEIDGVRLVLKKGQDADGPVPAAVPVRPNPSDAAVPAADILAGDDGVVEVTSPVLGTFYRAPEPGAAPYVSVGDSVVSGSVLGMVEVMKLFNEVRSDVAGEVIEILVGDGEMVEYGQPLLRLKKA